jgi:hypothetical protein
MNYTDQEILDLETSLDEVGHAKQVVLVLVEPDGWDKRELGRFGPFMEKTHGGELVEAGLTTSTSMILVPPYTYNIPRSIIKIMGPALRATAALNELYDKYNCQMALDFSE